MFYVKIMVNINLSLSTKLLFLSVPVLLVYNIFTILYTILFTSDMIIIVW